MGEITARVRCTRPLYTIATLRSVEASKCLCEGPYWSVPEWLQDFAIEMARITFADWRRKKEHWVRHKHPSPIVLASGINTTRIT